MCFKWDELETKWFLDASVYTGFHRTLAEKIIPHLKPEYTLCDIGCGLGRLDLELASHVRELTAIDINEKAISLLKRDVRAQCRNNLRVQCRDASTITEHFDIFLMSFFGKMGIFDYLKLCCRKLIRVVNAENKSCLYPSHHRRNDKDTIPIVREELEAQGIGYDLELCSIEFGQPLESLRDAEQFILRNAPEATAEEVSKFQNKHLTRTGREDFPFYLQNRKELGIFIINRED